MARRLWLMLSVAGTIAMIGPTLVQAQPAPWCLRWNDGCSTCARPNLGGAVTCAQKKDRCVMRPVRCELADREELSRRCEEWRKADSCNVCSGPPGRPQLCTLRGCPPGESWIVCVRVRRK
jgi:hypothetical protein